MSTAAQIIISAVLVFAFTATSIAGDTYSNSNKEMLKDFAFLIGKVRGAVRYHLEHDKECLPWVSLAMNPNDREANLDFNFTPEMLVKVGDVSAKGLGKFLAIVPKDSYTLGVIGTCQTDSTNKEGQTPNIIALHLERSNGSAITIRFPFEQKGSGQVSYIKNKVAIRNATPLLFVRSGG